MPADDRARATNGRTDGHRDKPLALRTAADRKNRRASQNLPSRAAINIVPIMRRGSKQSRGKSPFRIIAGIMLLAVLRIDFTKRSGVTCNNSPVRYTRAGRKTR